MGRRDGDGRGGGRRERRGDARGKVADEEGGRAFKEQGKMLVRDRQLGSLFRLQPTSDDICENKTLCGYARRMHLYLILYQKTKKERKIEDSDISGFL